MIKVVIITGQTASGKSELAVKIAKKIKGEIISVDSRQVYKELDIGSGKVEAIKKDKYFLYKDIIHHGLNIASVKKVYTVAQFQSYARKKIKEIIKRGNVPILCGGSLMWIQAVTTNMTFPESNPNTTLRKQLEKIPLIDLQKLLQNLDNNRYTAIDIQNKRRVIRAIEIIKTLGKVPEKTKIEYLYNCLYLSPKISQEDLDKKILVRLIKREKEIIKEVKNLLQNKISHKKLHSLGLEYRYASLYLQKKITKQQLTEELFIKIRQFSRRQLTWMRKIDNIKTFDTTKEYITECIKFIEK